MGQGVPIVGIVSDDSSYSRHTTNPRATLTSENSHIRHHFSTPFALQTVLPGANNRSPVLLTAQSSNGAGQLTVQPGSGQHGRDSNVIGQAFRVHYKTSDTVNKPVSFQLFTVDDQNSTLYVTVNDVNGQPSISLSSTDTPATWQLGRRDEGTYLLSCVEHGVHLSVDSSNSGTPKIALVADEEDATAWTLHTI